MISSGAARALNHLLAHDDAARERLARHPGTRIEFRSAPFPPVQLLVLETGQVSASEGEAADLVVNIKPFALPLVALHSPQAMAHVEIAGPDGVAATVRALMLELRWDFEEDLSKLVGDVAARRVAQGGRDALAWQRDAGERLARNFAEYWTEEQPMLARRPDAEAFARELQALQSRIERAEEALARLSSRAQPKP